MLEIACFDKESAFVAEANRADHIEFCSNLDLGGTTPSLEDFVEIISKIKIPIYVMIRPRGGDFVYSLEEFELMKHQLDFFKNHGADGFVFGVLTKDQRIDEVRNRELIELATPFPCTFHRAFDRLNDLEKNLEQVIDVGFSTVLTSGQKNNVNEGKENLKRLVEIAQNRIAILMGGGLRSSNIKAIRDFTRGSCFHSSALLDGKTVADAEEVKRLKNQNK